MNDHQPLKRRVTLADVARTAGVSQMTVSKVMRNTGSISKATGDRVRAAAQDLGYVPNRLAGSLSSRSSDIVAVILPSINDAIFGDVVSGINEILRPHGYLTFIGESNFEPEREEDIIKTILSLHPAGIILTGGIQRTENAYRLLKGWQCPTLQIWDDLDVGFDGTVSPNHQEAGRLTAQHFANRGFQNPAYIGAELDKDLCAGRRLCGFRDELEKSRTPLFELIEQDLPRRYDSGRVLAERLMDLRPKTDAVYCLNDAMALGALSWFHENGFNVPERVAVAGFNGTSLMHVVRTKLTTVHVERKALGKSAAQGVIALLNNEKFEAQSVLNADLIVGNTT